MKKFFTILTFCGIALAGLFVLLLVLPRPAPPAPEPYEVQQARTQAALAELQRQQDNARFWSSFIQFASFISFGIIVVIVICGLLYIFAARSHQNRLDLIKAERDYDLVSADQNGNYPVYLDREGREFIRAKPGNRPYPDPPAQFIIGNSPAAKLSDGRGRDEIPILSYDYRRRPAPGAYEHSVRVINPGQLEGPGPDRTVQAERSGGFENGDFEANVQSANVQGSDVGALLARAKLEGEGKQDAIERITGVTKGGSKRWKIYSDYWDGLPKI